MTYNELISKLNELGLKKADMCKEVDISPQILTNAKKRGGHFSATTEQKIRAFFMNHEPNPFVFAGTPNIVQTSFESDMYISKSDSNVDVEPNLQRLPNKKEVLLLYLLTQLNEDGFDEIMKRAEELTQLNKYKKDGE